MASSFYTGYPLSLIFGNGVSLRVVVDIYPRRWQKVSRNAHFLRLSLGEKLVWGVNRCAGLGNGQRPFPVEAGSGKEGGRSEKKGEHFDGGSSGFSCSRMRTCSFLL